MDHVSAIKSYVQTMLAVPDQHILIIEGPPGWGKTETTDKALEQAKIDAVHLGSYSTPLNFYNFLSENSNRVVVIDDTAGLLNDQSSMALLKAATWPQRGNKRIVKWGSTSSKAAVSEFEFLGKIIVICNSFPKSPDGEAIRSRGFAWRIDITPVVAKDLLIAAALDGNRYAMQNTAIAVAEYLASKVTETTLPSISYRTLMKAYRLAEVNPESWEKLLAPLLPSVSNSPEELIKELAKDNLKVKDQVRIFEDRTGLKARSFYYYRRNANLSRYQDR